MLYTVNNLTVVYTINNCLIAQCTVLISLYMPPPIPQCCQNMLFLLCHGHVFCFFIIFKILFLKIKKKVIG